jgi:hypothetical protein
MTSDDWQDDIMPDPFRILWLLEECLTMTNKAYLLKSTNTYKYVKGLRYILPTSIAEIATAKDGLTGFKRSLSGGQTQGLSFDDIAYFYQPNMWTEAGSGKDFSPAQAALQASQVLYSLDAFIALYFKRGAIKATILSVDGNPDKEERERLKSWWNRTLSGIRNAWQAEVVNAQAVKATVIGEGLEALNKTALVKEAREDISTALGIPQTMLFSNAANYATAMQDAKWFIKNTIIPECNLISEVLTNQVYYPNHFEFRPQSLEEFQEDISQQAIALASLVSSGMKLSLAAQIVGIELPADVEYKDLEPEPEPEPKIVIQEPNPMTPIDEEYGKWKRKAIKAIESGKSASVKFESSIIPVDEFKRIKESLVSCQTTDEVKDVFKTGNVLPGFTELVAELKRANDLLEKTDEKNIKGVA